MLGLMKAASMKEVELPPVEEDSDWDYEEPLDPELKMKKMMTALAGGDKMKIQQKAEQSSVLWKVKAKDGHDERVRLETERSNLELRSPSPTLSEKERAREERRAARQEEYRAKKREARRQVEVTYFEPILKETRQTKDKIQKQQEEEQKQARALEAQRWQRKCELTRKQMQRMMQKRKSEMCSPTAGEEDMEGKGAPTSAERAHTSPDPRLNWMRKGMETRQQFRNVRMASPPKKINYKETLGGTLPMLKGAKVNLKNILPFPHSQGQILESAVWLNTSGFNNGDFNLHSQEYSRTGLDITAAVHPSIARDSRGYSRRHNGILRVAGPPSPPRVKSPQKWSANWYRTDAWKELAFHNRVQTR